MTLAPEYQITNITTCATDNCKEGGDICYLAGSFGPVFYQRKAYLRTNKMARITIPMFRSL